MWRTQGGGIRSLPAVFCGLLVAAVCVLVTIREAAALYLSVDLFGSESVLVTCCFLLFGSTSWIPVVLDLLCTTISEIVWLSWLLADLGVSAPIFTRSHCQQSTIQLQYVPSDLQVADFFTKAQTREQHKLHILKLNVSHPP